MREYVDTRFISPTSNVCERLFSPVGHVFNYQRRGLTPANLEAQIILKANRDQWAG